MESIEKLAQLLQQKAASDTSSVPEQWTKENPMLGHCAIVAILVQDYFGGKLLRVSLEDSKEFGYLHSHYWNKIESGQEIDLTKSQFLGLELNFLDIQERSKEKILSNSDTLRRYNLLKSRII